jgi:hypothetical protein
MTFTLPTVTVTEPRIPYPLPFIPDISALRPIMPNIDANRGEFTNLIQLYQSVQTLDQQLDPLGKDIDFILSQLSPEERSSLSGISRHYGSKQLMPRLMLTVNSVSSLVV